MVNKGIIIAAVSCFVIGESKASVPSISEEEIQRFFRNAKHVEINADKIESIEEVPKKSDKQLLLDGIHAKAQNFTTTERRVVISPDFRYLYFSKIISEIAAEDNNPILKKLFIVKNYNSLKVPNHAPILAELEYNITPVDLVTAQALIDKNGYQPAIEQLRLQLKQKADLYAGIKAGFKAMFSSSDGDVETYSKPFSNFLELCKYKVGYLLEGSDGKVLAGLQDLLDKEFKDQSSYPDGELRIQVKGAIQLQLSQLTDYENYNSLISAFTKGKEKVLQRASLNHKNPLHSPVIIIEKAKETDGKEKELLKAVVEEEKQVVEVAKTTTDVIDALEGITDLSSSLIMSQVIDENSDTNTSAALSLPADSVYTMVKLVKEEEGKDKLLGYTKSSAQQEHVDEYVIWEEKKVNPGYFYNGYINSYTLIGNTFGYIIVGDDNKPYRAYNKLIKESTVFTSRKKDGHETVY